MSAYGGRLFAQQHSQHYRRRIFRKATQRFASRRPLRLLRGVVIRPRLMIVAHDAIPVRNPVELCISRFDLASRQPSRQQTRRLRIDLPTEGGCPKPISPKLSGEAECERESGRQPRDEFTSSDLLGLTHRGTCPNSTRVHRGPLQVSKRSKGGPCSGRCERAGHPKTAETLRSAVGCSRR